MFEKEEASSIMGKLDKPKSDDFLCPETGFYTSKETCCSTCFEKGCKFCSSCKSFLENNRE